MKIKNRPSTIFFKELYTLIEEFARKNDLGSYLDITIKNIYDDKEYIQKEFPIIENDFRSMKKTTDIKYVIDVVELTSFQFKNTDIKELYEERYKNYIEHLGLKFCAETVFVLTLLHEFGHIEYINKFIEYADTEGNFNTFIAYSKALSGLYESNIKPWEFGSFTTLNISNIMFNSIEGFPELFSFKHFPYFIKFLKEYGFGKVS